jgi:hypothetical protein
MKVLLDNGVVSSSNFLVAASREQQVKWGKTVECISIDGFKRADLDHDPDQQREKDASFTIGRLVRAGRISLHTYSELSVENWRRGRGSEPLVELQDEILPLLVRSEFAILIMCSGTFS